MTDIEQLEQTVATLEAQRASLGDAVVEAALPPLREKLAALRKNSPALTKEAKPEAGERKLVTVMFADISGFTALSEKMDPETVRNLMNACFERLVPAIEKYEGTVDKFIGDEIMALFGAPVTHENDPEWALRAALEMLEALARFNIEHKTQLGLHFGINTGLVLAGGIGSQGRQQYSVMGDAVNLAARLEDASERGEIFVGPDTYRLTNPLFDFESLPPLRVKGKAEPVAIWRLRGHRAMPHSLRGIEGLHSPLVGRETELRCIQTVLQRLSEGKGGQVAILAEAGLGKSRLVAEARQALTEHVTWIEGRCLSYTEGMSYWVARDVLYGLIGVKADAPLTDLAAALRQSVERLFPNQLAEVYLYLARLLDVPLETEMEERIKDLSAAALQRRMLEAYGEYIRVRSLDQPLVLVWEDLHWADPSSLHLLETLLPLADQVPLLMLLVFRPEEGGALTLHQHCQTTYSERYQVIELVPLTGEESAQLAQNLLRIENLPDETRKLILDKAEGNPFFLEELLRSLIDAGFVVLQGESATAARPIRDVDVPDTLQGVIAARIDRLPPENKRTLQTASVVGRVFQQRVLAHLLVEERANVHLDTALTELRRREFIRLRATDTTTGVRPVDLEYIFKHVVTQEVTYNSLLIARRKVLHQVTGEAIEALFPNDLDELAATLAYHFERAEVRDKAIRYLTRAADRAKATYANTEAIALYQAAINQVRLMLEAEPAEAWREVMLQLHESLGDILALTGQYDEARGTYQDALAEIPKPDVIGQSRLHRKTAKVLETQRRYEEALQAYQLAEATVGQSSAESSLEWRQEWIQIQLDYFMLYYWRGQAPEMIELAEKARPVVEQYGMPLQRGRFFQGLSMMMLRRDRYLVSDELLAYARASFTAIQELENVSELALIQFMLGFILLWHGDLDEAETQLQASLILTERTGDIVLQSRCLTYLTVLCRKRREVEAAQRYIERSLAAATAGKMLEYIGMAKANLAWVAWRARNLAEVQVQGQAALEVFQQVPQGGMFLWVALWPLIAGALAQGQIMEAIDYARRLLPPPQMRLPVALESVLQDAIIAWDGGEEEKGHTYLKQATQLAQTLGYL